ncbi:S-adenosyl-L-methionine-dependent methyltransferase [Lepidopterella palustris CBS 459.81]|uniref:S-adenosyl-L-methionine-dependent methyltransferase n=1 Tax=Lepidopterella palustris CBS 459.81 TaxID=1314670 RepID=A0A8E2EEJ4_9PEZI|nr:S-adenosyl-L-methionine-dependent methyltransferase [Lepidopterella palustris CBS 459.81]
MGKRGNKNFRGRGRGGGRGGGGPRGPAVNYTAIEKQNEIFEGYYNGLELVGEGELGLFWEAMRKELPNSFRFAGSKGHALAVQQRLIDTYIPEITAVQFNGQSVPPPTPISWYPEQLAWSMTTPKQVVRKFPPFASFQKFLVSETSVGNISRQEVVSMIPPLLMDIKPGMTVLDLCAAPGSKSAQLAEMVHGGEEARVRQVLHTVAKQQGREISPDGREIEAEKSQAETEDDWEDDGRSTGLLIANDVDNRRAHMLVHQVKRLNSPNLIVTNHDATMFPSIEIESGPDNTKRYLKFDRILADVPCSGDGTCRKNPGVWKDWTPGNGLGLHVMQVRILVRALQMLKVGGRVVYSTCSLNPVENEAVIASAIDRCGGLSHVRLLNCSDALPGLKRRPGLTKWKVMDKIGRFWDSWNDVVDEKEQNGDEGLARLSEGMFPPTASSDDDRYPLERCIRIYPHLQDTGGFFITVLEKLSEIKARPESGPKKVQISTSIKNQNGHATPPSTSPIKRELDETDDVAASPKRIKTAHDAQEEEDDDLVNNQHISLGKDDAEMMTEDADASLGPVKTALEPDEVAPASARMEAEDQSRDFPRLKTENPFKRKTNQPQEEPFKYLDPNHEELTKIYSFYDISPRFPRDRWMVRNATGQPAKAIYYTSALAREILTRMEGKGMKFVHCGVKMFMKQDVQGKDTCRWRIQSDGLPIVEPWVGEVRIVRLYKRETLRKLLIEMFPLVARDGWKDLGEIGERVRDIDMGCCVLRVETSDDEDGFKDRMVLPLWRSISSVNLMLPKEDRKALLLRLFNDDSPLIDHSKDSFNRPKDESERSTSNTKLEELANTETKTDDQSTTGEAEDVIKDEMEVVEVKDPVEMVDEDEDDEIDGGVPLV